MMVDTTSPTQVHPSALVEDGARVGPGTVVWHRGHVRAGATVGSGCTLGFAVYVDAGAVVGDRCKLQNHVCVYRGVTLGDDVFVGPHVTFTNDRYPRAHAEDWELVPTHVGDGASLGAGAVVVCGVSVGAHAMVAAGAVVTRDVPPHGLVVGSPARLRGWVCRCGRPLGSHHGPQPARCPSCGAVTPEWSR